MKRIIAICLVGFFLISASCHSSQTNSATSVSDNGIAISVSRSETEPAETTAIDISMDDLIIENLQIDRSDFLNQRVTGQISNHINVDAELLCSVNPEKPGNASVYSCEYVSFSETQRFMFTQSDWTLVESESLPPDQNGGDKFLDRYTDSKGEEYLCTVFPGYFQYSTSRGIIISQITEVMSADYYAAEDFSFADSETAFATARSFLESEGFSISDYHVIRRLPHDEIETETHEFNLYAEAGEKLDIAAALPDGWTDAEDSYWITLYPDVDGLPLGCEEMGSVSFSGDIIPEGKTKWPEGDVHQISKNYAIDVIINSHGVEYVLVFRSFEVTEIQSSGTLLSIEDALNSFSRKLFSESEPLSYHDVSLYRPEPITINEVSLVYLAEHEKSLDSDWVNSIKPYWVILSSQIVTDKNYKGERIVYYTQFYMDAISGLCPDVRDVGTGLGGNGDI